MAHLYVTDNGSLIGVEGGRFVIHQKKELVKSIPKESVESISIFGNSTMTTPCIQEILESNIPVCFFFWKRKVLRQVSFYFRGQNIFTEAAVQDNG